MFEPLVLLLIAVIACAAWQFIPAFRSLVKATLVVAAIMIALWGAWLCHLSGSVIADKALGGAVGGLVFGLVIGLARALTRKVGGSMPRWRNGIRVQE